MMVVYHFTRIDDFCRAALRVLVDRGNRVSPTIQDIYPGANWHERETHDFFGILFSGHPDMTPLILPEDAGDLCPLLKADEKALKDLGAILPRFAPPASAEEGSEKAPAKEKKKPEVDA
jgi:NADH-quinone oxidoreductase subunit C